MPTEPVIRALAFAVLCAIACSDEDDRPRGPPGGAGGRAGTGGSQGGSGTGGAGNPDAAGGTSGEAGQAGSSGSSAGEGGVAGTSGAGAGGDGGWTEDSGTCGNGVAEPNEACDDADFRGTGCKSYGFEQGDLECDGCSVVLTGCSGTESCVDGRDNDGDRVADCLDSDCAATCDDACASPALLPDPAIGIQGFTNGHAAELEPSCLRSGVASGPEVAYRFTASRSGVLDVRVLSTFADLNVSVRGACGNAGSEQACSETIAGANSVEHVTLPVSQGDSLFIVVDGTGSAEQGGFTLDAKSRAVRCGDALRDANEECDDGNENSNDGCSSGCVLESDESEPNDSTGQADDYTSFPFHAAIAAASDVDVFAISVPSGAGLVAETFDFGDGACSQLTLDSKVEIVAPNGTTVLASDDDSGAGYCASVSASSLSAGTHFVRVRASGAATAFPYVLNVSVQP
jgi:cysteine-rich repeat protein